MGFIYIEEEILFQLTPRNGHSLILEILLLLYLNYSNHLYIFIKYYKYYFYHYKILIKDMSVNTLTNDISEMEEDGYYFWMNIL